MSPDSPAVPRPAAPTLYSRADHGISRSAISEAALKVLYRLHNAGFRACLVGGSVRDLLLGREPKDFDVATDARPEQVRELFRNCRLVGRRFLLAHVRYGDEIIEVATFRAGQIEGEEPDGDLEIEDDGRILRDNIYGTLEEDAWRRDFTANALYYDIADFSVVDYAGGMADLRAGTLRLIGEPEQRYREDPVRMLRAARFAVKLGFRLHPDTEAPLARLASLLDAIPPARLFEEVLKLFQSGHAEQTFEALRHWGLFGHLFPATEAALAYEEGGYPHLFIVHALRNTDARVREGKPVAPFFLFAALLWEPLCARAGQLAVEGLDMGAALYQAAEDVVREQTRRVSIPKRYSLPMREIWQLQERFTRRSGQRPLRFLEHPRFRAAFDFLALRAQAGEDLGELVAWWDRLQQVEGADRDAMLVPEAGRKPRRRRRRGRGGSGAGGDGGDA